MSTAGSAVECLAGLFPGARPYRSLLLSGQGVVREDTAGADPFPFSERHLQCVWFDDGLRPSRLCSASGEEVTVEQPGRWNLEAGPDFTDAVLCVGPERRRLQGDVELHIRPSDWRQHKHAADPGYNRLVAHVTYFAGVLPPGELPPGALEISLRDDLRAARLFSFDDIDVTAYPFAALPARDAPCRTALRQWSPDDQERLLEEAGQERLRLKAERTAADITAYGLEQALYEGCLAALGYKHNRKAFRDLARRVNVSALQDACAGSPECAYALLLGVAALLPTQVSPRWDADTREFVRRLWDHWWRMRSAWETRIMAPTAWRLAGLRPQNHPLRRLAAAAALFCADSGLLARLRACDMTRPRDWFKHGATLLDTATELPYWRNRLSLAGQPRTGAVKLIGPQRIAAMLSNVVIPCLAATGAEVTPLLGHLPAEADNSLIRQTAHTLFGRDHNPALYHTGLRQQGLLQIFHDFCLTERNGCRACRLAAGINAQKKGIAT